MDYDWLNDTCWDLNPHTSISSSQEHRAQVRDDFANTPPFTNKYWVRDIFTLESLEAAELTWHWRNKAAPAANYQSSQTRSKKNRAQLLHWCWPHKTHASNHKHEGQLGDTGGEDLIAGETLTVCKFRVCTLWRMQRTQSVWATV